MHRAALATQCITLRYAVTIALLYVLWCAQGELARSVPADAAAVLEADRAAAAAAAEARAADLQAAQLNAQSASAALEAARAEHAEARAALQRERAAAAALSEEMEQLKVSTTHAHVHSLCIICIRP